MQQTQDPSLGGEDPLEQEMAIHSSILAWSISWDAMPSLESSFENQVETSAEYLAQGLQSKFLLRGNWLAFCTLCLPGKEGSPGRWKRSKPAG